MTWMENIKKQQAEREAKRSKELGEVYQKELNDLLNFYFNNYETAKADFEKINLEWKKLCQKVNNKQKVIRLKLTAFEDEAKRIIAENPQFQDVTDITKL